MKEQKPLELLVNAIVQDEKIDTFISFRQENTKSLGFLVRSAPGVRNVLTCGFVS